MQLKSAYEGKEPQYTVFTDSIKESIDYIWYTPSTLVVKKVDEHWKDVKNPLPSEKLSSDHIAIGAVFQWK